MKPAFTSGIMRSGRVPLDADIAGAKKLWLVVTDGGDGYSCDWADWIEPKLIRADGSTVLLTSLKWKSATAGWGQVNINKNCAGGPLRMDKRSFTNGIGTHASSIIEYELRENFSRFTAKVGPDVGGLDQNGGTSIEFLLFTEPPPVNVFASAAESERGFGFEAAKDSLKKMTVADGLEVSLFASEPMVRNPTDMDIDARGRVWVTEGVNYRATIKPWGILQPAGDRIVILEDSNGDGVADKETTFYQGNDVNAALGICVLGNKVLVSSSPNVFIFTDADGDGKADKKEILFSGISGVDHDHGVHAVVFGPDGKLYFNFGNHGGQLKDKNGKQVIDIFGNEVSNSGKPYRQGMTFRCNLDGSEVEVLACNFRNPYEVCVDSFGTVWQSDNDDDGNRGVRINYVMEHGNFGYTDEITGAAWGEAWRKASAKGATEQEKIFYQWHQHDPGVVPNLLHTGAGSPTGICVYEGNLLPKIFHGSLIHCDAGPRIVRAYKTKPDGAGYKAEIVDILSSSDSWFRPSDVCVAPDGSLFIADWNDAGVGGHNMADHDPSKITGRIFRVAPRTNLGAPASRRRVESLSSKELAGETPALPGARPISKLDLNTPAGCVAALQSPNQATRYLAWTKLHEMQGKTEKDLAKIWQGNVLPASRRQSARSNADVLIQPRRQDADDTLRMRARALQLLTRIQGKEKKYLDEAIHDKEPDIRIEGLRIARELKLDVIPYVMELVSDASPQVRRECAIALRHNSAIEAPLLWTQLALKHEGKDRWYLEALGIGADGQWEKFFGAWLAAVGKNWNTPAGRDIVWRSRSSKTPAMLVKLISDNKTSESERERYLRALDFISGPEKDAALLDLLSEAK